MMAPRDLAAGLTLILGMSLTLGVLALTACQSQPRTQAPELPPAPIYTGPELFHGTVGSMTRVRGFEPLLVSGFGVVVNLPGTGSSEVPAFLRQWLINEMRKKGLGNPQYGAAELSPQRVLADPGKSIVVVQGLIPPGAKKGTRFDVMVTALDSQTISLEGGRLWSTDLAVDGANPALRYSRPLAVAEAGDLYVNPLEERSFENPEYRSSAVVLSGGKVTVDRELELILNQPSWQRSRMIADRINERFPRGPGDRWPVAEPQTDAIIRINIPRAYSDDPAFFLRLMSKLYVQRTPRFEPEQAQRLAQALLADPNPELAEDVALAWVALGKNALREVQRYYQYPHKVIRLAALEAGALLGDEQCVDSLVQLARDPDPQVRIRCAKILSNLPQSLRGSRTLQEMLDDPDRDVRIAAYEALAKINDPVLQRIAMGAPDNFKFMLELVPSRLPLVYICQVRLPRIVIFGPNTGFHTPMLARLWENRLMIRCEGPGQNATVFYQPPGNPEGQTIQIAPALANLIFLMAHKPSKDNPAEGLDLPYSRVVSAVVSLHRQGFLDADLYIQASPLAEAIERASRVEPVVRPETGPAGVEPGGRAEGKPAGEEKQ